MPALIPALIIGGGALAGAAISAGATGAASDAASNAAASNNALESQIYDENSANAQPYIQSGDAANTALNGFLGLGGDPAASQAALNDYLDSTGYQFTLNQGLQAAQQNAASSGMLNSGATLKALDAYGTGLADQYGQQYAQDLQGVVNTGEGAANALAGEGQSYANAVSSNTDSAASATADAALAGASNSNSLIGNALKAYGATQGASSFAGGAQAISNAFAYGG